jgi:hypothetical protein
LRPFSPALLQISQWENSETKNIRCLFAQNCFFFLSLCMWGTYRSTSGHLPPEANFVSSNIYLRPLPSTFTPLDLHELCMSMIRRTPDSRLLTLYNPDRNADDDDDDTHGDPNLSDNPANTTTHQEFRILSVKVMIEEEDQASLGSCKGIIPFLIYCVSFFYL